MVDDTRQRILGAALEQFANRGFYGASLTGIVTDLGLTKQALLHHFGSKEKLYGELLQQISEPMVALVTQSRQEHDDPAAQLEAALIAMYDNGRANPRATKILVRELLDSERRVERIRSWYLTPFLAELVDIVCDIAGQGTLSERDALSHVYPLLGAMSYFNVSDVVLPQMYGPDTYQYLQDRYPERVREQVADLVSHLRGER